MLIGILVIAAVALLAAAFLTGNTVLAGAALVVSIGAALVYGFSLRRAPEAEDAEQGEMVEKAEKVEDEAPVVADDPVETTVAAEEKAPVAEEKAPVEETPVVASGGDGAAAPTLAGTTVVHVVPGRMRYHVQGCQVIDGQEVEDLTVDDARDEGFTACSRCAALGRSHATA